MRPSIALAALGTCALVLGLMLLPITSCGCKVATRGAACLSNVKQQALGLVMYADDFEGRFPPRERWMDGNLPYIKSEAVLHDPEGPNEGYGYAFNAALSRAKSPAKPENWPLIYDSSSHARNAFDPFTSFPHPGRHHGKNSLAYADGHVRLRRTDESKR